MLLCFYMFLQGHCFNLRRLYITWEIVTTEEIISATLDFESALAKRDSPKSIYS